MGCLQARVREVPVARNETLTAVTDSRPLAVVIRPRLCVGHRRYPRSASRIDEKQNDFGGVRVANDIGAWRNNCRAGDVHFPHDKGVGIVGKYAQVLMENG